MAEEENRQSINRIRRRRKRSHYVDIAEDGDNAEDLTTSYACTLADRITGNVDVNLDTDDAFHREEENRQSINRRRRGRKRSHHVDMSEDSDNAENLTTACTSADRITGNVDVNLDADDSFHREEENRQSKNRQRRGSKKTVIIDEPRAKKAKKSLGSCSICFEEYCGQSLASTKCGHVFCLACLKRALNKDPRCPTCRTNLKGKSGYHILFL